MARVKEDCRCLTGSQKASIPLLSLGQDQTAKLLNMMENEEIKEVSQIMSGRAAKMLKEVIGHSRVVDLKSLGFRRASTLANFGIATRCGPY